jgi:hypothetical protein
MTHWLRALSAFPLSLPLAFEPAPEPDRFVARQADARVEVACDSLTVSWGGPESVALRFSGASQAARPVASERQPGRVHYLIGRDPSRWRRDLPLYGRITCAGLHPGLDLALHGREGRVEFDVIAAPGADLSAFELTLPGAVLEPDGHLALRAGERRLVLRAPVAYQELAGERRPVESRFAPRGDGRFGFAVGTHDRAAPLVVDPVLELSTFAGGNRIDTARAVAIDDDGSVVVAGSSESNDFPTTASSVQPDYAGGNDDFERGDAFVMKLAPGGTSLVWATYLGGNDPDAAEDVALGPSGDVFLVGGTLSHDFPVTPGALQPERAKNTFDAFAARLGPDGDMLVYSTYLGGRDADFANGVAVGASNEATVVGYAFSKDFPVTAAAFQPEREGSSDAFVARLAPNGDALVWSTYLGGGEEDAAEDVALGADDAPVVAGVTDSKNFPTTPGAFQEERPGEVDAFVTRLAPNGSALVWSSFFGGDSSPLVALDEASSVALDAFESVYLAGRTLSRDLPVTPDALDTHCDDDCTAGDAYVAKLSADGCGLLYGTFLGGGDVDAARAVATDGRGHAHVTGFTASGGFPTTDDAFQPNKRDAADVFVSELDGNGSTLVYSTFLGSNDEDGGNGVALSDAPRTHVVGSTSGGAFPIAGTAFQDVYGGSTDAFVSVFGGPAAMEPALLTSLELPGPIGAGSPFSGTLRVRNAGSAAAANVAASITFDAALAVDTATPSQGSCIVAAPDVTCTLGALAAGAEAEIDLAGDTSGEGVFSASAETSATASGIVRAAACVAAEIHDLAITSLKVPKSVKVPSDESAEKKLTAQVENLSNHPERIVDLTMLGDLVTLDVTPTGGGCGPAGVALDPKIGDKLPMDLEPGKKLKVTFLATFDCADTDFTATATVDHTALDGLVDSNPTNDALSSPVDAVPK